MCVHILDAITRAETALMLLADLYTLPNGTITLTTCGAGGRVGPTAIMCQRSYNASGYGALVPNYLTVINNGTQVFTVPRTTLYNITVASAHLLTWTTLGSVYIYVFLCPM